MWKRVSAAFVVGHAKKKINRVLVNLPLADPAVKARRLEGWLLVYPLGIKK